MSSHILFVGDTHGDLTKMRQVIKYCIDHGITQILQVGDWGFIWPTYDFHRQQLKIPYTDVTQLSKLLVDGNINMHFCDGNHDFHPELRKYEYNINNIAPNITYQPRGSVFRYPDGPSVMFLGGAPSIDKTQRTPGISWWKEEYITEYDVDACLTHRGETIDILASHDAGMLPDDIHRTNDMGFNYRQQESFLLINKVLEEIKPKLHIHGHYHHRYEKIINNIKTIGLGSNFSTLERMVYCYEG